MNHHPAAHRRTRWSVSFTLCLSAALAGCSSGGGERGASPAIQLEIGSLPDGAVSSNFEFTATASGGQAPYTFQVSDGQLPPGLNLSPSGALQGTPTQGGVYNSTIVVEDSSSPSLSGSGNVSIFIAPAGSDLEAFTSSFPAATTGLTFAERFVVAGGVPPYTFTVAEGELPPGMSLNGQTGWVSGLSTSPGAYEFTLQVEDSAQPAATLSRELSMAVTSLPGQGTQPTASVVVDQTSGVAPLGVVFDATGSTMTGVARPFHEFDYHWCFDDPESGHSHASGAVAAHVFEDPGTYTVRMTLTAGFQQVAHRTVTITVTDPDSVYAGSDTVCFSTDGNFSGAPAGAQQVTTSSFDTALGHFGDGKRLLFKRGQTFTSSNPPHMQVSTDAQLGAFGTGTSPDAQGIYSNNPVISCATNNTPIRFRGDGMRVTDLTVAGGVSTLAEIAVLDPPSRSPTGSPASCATDSRPTAPAAP